MPYTLVASTAKGATNDATVTTNAIDTSGATLLVLTVHAYLAHPFTATPSDSKANTWTRIRSQDSNNAGADPTVELYYSLNPTVGAGHTFSFNPGSGGPVVCVGAFAGSHASAVVDQSNGAGLFANNTSQVSGSITPTADNCLVISALCQISAGATPAVSGGSLVVLASAPSVSAQCVGGAMAYEIQTTAAARQASWSWTGNSGGSSALIGSFLPGASGSGSGTAQRDAFLLLLAN